MAVDHQELKDAALGETVLFGLLGRLLYKEPTFDEVQALLDNSVFDALPFGGEHPQSAEGLVILQAWQSDNAAGLTAEEFDALKTDFFYLFLGVGKPLATIWESVYFHQTRSLFGPETLKVRAWYSHYGLEIDKKGTEPDDHLGLELLFISHLSRLAYEALEASDDERYEGLSDARRQFIADHPMRWAEQWKVEVLKNARTDFFRGIALLVVGALKDAA